MTIDKFSDLKITADGSERAYVDPLHLKTVWFNIGTRCNLTCENCYIESSPTNDELVYINDSEVKIFLNEIQKDFTHVQLIGLTGGEPFLNPSIMKIIESVLSTGLDILVLTNAFKAVERHLDKLSELTKLYQDKLHIRISLDHYTKELHEKERGEKTFERTLQNIQKLYNQKINISIAGRSLMSEKQNESKAHYHHLFQKMGVQLSEDKMVIFPEMDLNKSVPEITTACWDILKVSPSQQMCASERMIVKRKGQDNLTVLPCTLIAYDERFNMGHSLKEGNQRVYLCHKFCAQFCVLGGASCSAVK
ncbi:radical SAM domain protein [Bacteriovorax sp. BSW11_IV]|uniref:radical SAM protein n=1 Tax=Bacteriovorax sp. BSW11_IV TaxID=1353529 RepID=UPI000389F29A|nr:radical SAM protein [Bacteriovorax sp. BSW11_IV]EQC49302.1 radical SAM domain protein [Bacteriovorax sp. BSW11_IV]